MVINITITYVLICGVMTIGAVIGLLLKWLERILA